MLAKSRILNRPPTLTQTHPLQSSPKRTQRKKHISNLRLFSANSTNSNAARTSTAAAPNQSSRAFVNNRGPTWTFAMISSHNSNSNNSSSSNSRPPRRGSSPQSSGPPSRGGLPFNRSFGPKKENRIAANPMPGNQKNNTVGLSGLQASSPPVQSNKPLRSSGSSSKLLSSTRRPFLSRSINYRPPPVNPVVGTNQTAPARTLESDLSPNRSIESSRPKPSTNAKPPNVPNAGKPKTTTIVAISSGQHPFNFNPVQFMQTFFDQLFSPAKANGGGGNFFSFFN